MLEAKVEIDGLYQQLHLALEYRLSFEVCRVCLDLGLKSQTASATSPFARRPWENCPQAHAS